MRGAENIKLLAFDVDGTLTPGELFFGAEGEVYKVFHVRDGMAMGMAHQLGLITGLVTGRASEMVRKRGEELHVDFLLMGVSRKVEALQTVLDEHRLSWENVAFMGDDLNDLPVMTKAGLSGCPADAAKEVTMSAGFVSQYPGGHGAVREFIEEILKAQKLWDKTVNGFIQNQ